MARIGTVANGRPFRPIFDRWERTCRRIRSASRDPFGSGPSRQIWSPPNPANPSAGFRGEAATGDDGRRRRRSHLAASEGILQHQKIMYINGQGPVVEHSYADSREIVGN